MPLTVAPTMRHRHPTRAGRAGPTHALAIAALLAAAPAVAEPPLHAYIGSTTPSPTPRPQSRDSAGLLTYFGGTPIIYGEGIYAVDVDPRTGALARLRLAASAPNTIWLTGDARRGVLYAGSSGPAGGVSAFRVDAATGDLSPLGQRGAGNIVHMTLDPAGRFLLAAEFNKGSVQVYPLAADGALGEMVQDVQIPEKPAHAHMIGFDRSGRFLLAADYGLDRLYAWRYEPATGALVPNSPAFFQMARGSGTRHFAISPDNRHLYLLEEHVSTIRAFDLDASGAALTLRETQHVSSVAPDFVGINEGAELLISRDGSHLYATNRQHDTLASLAIDRAGRLSFLGEAHTQNDYPRAAAFSPDERFLYVLNERGSSVALFRIDPRTGLASYARQSLAVPTPGTIAFVPAAAAAAR